MIEHIGTRDRFSGRVGTLIELDRVGRRCRSFRQRPEMGPVNSILGGNAASLLGLA